MNFNLNNSLKTSLNWLFPRKCISCSSIHIPSNHPLCEDCYENLPFQTHCCRQCGQHFAAHADYCGRCISHPPSFDACFCPFEYKGLIKRQIQEFKYYEKPELATQLAQLMSMEINANDIELPDLLIPTPLHTSRLRMRGYNQSLLIASSLSTQLNIPIAKNIISKHKKTDAQAQLSLKRRLKNVRGSFRQENQIHVKSVAIVDDVLTTGTTANEISKILKKNGVDYIQVWAIAHTT